MSTTEEPDDVLLGQVIDGRYRLLRAIGRGGMGAVYEAEAIRLGRRPCAVKVLLPEFTRNDSAIARFNREAELAGRIKHPNLVEIFDTGTTADGHGYIAMEMLRGESLGRLMRREAPLPWARAQHILTQLCRALAVAHAEKIVHRDMKPENCFRCERDGDPDFIKVLDFGIAKRTDTEGEDLQRLTATDTIVGTIAYMAYEQLNGGPIDHRVDVWALGVMLYQMLTGHLPFAGTSLGQICNAINNRDPEPMQTIAPHAAIPPAAEALVRRALARDRDDRFPNVQALARAIAEVHAERRDPDTHPHLTPEPLASSTFSSGPTAPLEQPPPNTSTAPVSPHGHTGLARAESADTGETTSPGRHLSLPPPLGESLETAKVHLPIPAKPAPAQGPAPALHIPPAAPSPRPALWLLAGLALTGVALIIKIASRTPETPPTPAATVTTSASPSAPPILAVAPKNTVPEAPQPPEPEPEPEPEPVNEPDPPPKIAPVPPTPKKPESYKTQVTAALKKLLRSAKVAKCAPLKIDLIKVSAKTGIATVQVHMLSRNSVLDLCLQQAFASERFPIGGPSDADIELRSHVLSKK